LSLTAGTRLGSYEVLSLLGKGGMGEVYRARDTKLKREVAIKILPDEFSRDADRVARFQREAEALASVNHANIAGIHSLEESNGSRLLILELVEGETLAERLKRGPVAVEEALSIAKSICEALEAAHEKGIVHRDLKPANVKITPEGNVKVLDFGLAKAFGGDVATVNLSNSPTISMAATHAGVILGTAVYMSPEQATGKQVDRSTDVWAFGCVLYEMLTAVAAFDGETTSEILAGILKSEPDWRRLPPATPEAIRRLLQRCLRKDRKTRLHDMADVQIEIEEELHQPAPQIAAGPGHARYPRFWMAATFLMLIVTATLGVVYIRLASTTLPETRLEIVTRPGRLSNFAISPDGRKVGLSGNNRTENATLDPVPRFGVRAAVSRHR
jgi:eukaryotic-like serine/threonine-protein kinase